MAGNEDKQEKGIEHFIDNPDDLTPADVERLEKQLADASASDTARPQVDAPDEDDEEAKKAAEAKAKEEAETKAKAEADAKAQAEAAKTPTGILAKDGQHVLPMSVLESERQARSAAEQAVRELAGKLVASNERIQALAKGDEDPNKGEQPSPLADLEAKVSKVLEEAPWMKDTMEALLGELKDQREVIGDLLSERDETRAMDAQQLQDAATQARTANPHLTLWAAERADLMKEAGAYDTAIRKDPVLSKRFVDQNGQPDFAKRFAHVVNLVIAAHPGETIPLPQTLKPAATAAEAAAAAEAATKAAAAKLKALEADDAGLTTLTDMHGGEPVARDITEKLENMSPVAMAAMFESMTPDKLNQFLAVPR